MQLNKQLTKLQEEVSSYESKCKNSQAICCELEKKQEQNLQTIQILTDSEHSMRLCLDEKKIYNVELEDRNSALEKYIMEVEQQSQIHSSEKQKECEKLQASLSEEGSRFTQLQTTHEMLIQQQKDNHLQIEELTTKLQILEEEMLLYDGKLTSAETICQNLSKQLNKSRTVILEKENSFLELTNELELFEQTSEELSQELNKSREDLANILGEKDKLQQQVISMGHTVQKMDSISSLKAELEEKYKKLERSHTELLQKSDKQDEEISCKLQALVDMETKTRKTTDMIQQLSTEKEEMISKLNIEVESKLVENATNKTLLKRVAELEEQLRTMEDVVMKANLVKEELSLEMQMIEERLHGAASHDEERNLEMAKLKSDFQLSSSREKTLCEENLSLSKNSETLQIELDALISEKHALIETTTIVQRELSLAQQKIQMMKLEINSEVTTLHNTVEEKNVETFKLQEIKNDLSQQLENKEEQNTKMNSDIRDLTSRCSSAESDRDGLQISLDEKSHELLLLNERIENLKRECSELKSDLELVRTERNELKSEAVVLKEKYNASDELWSSSMEKLILECEVLGKTKLDQKLEIEDMKKSFEEKIFQNDILVSQTEQLSEDMVSLEAKATINLKFLNLYNQLILDFERQSHHLQEFQQNLQAKDTEAEESQTLIMDLKIKLDMVEADLSDQRNTNEELTKVSLKEKSLCDELSLRFESQILILSEELNENRLKEQSLCAAVSKIIKEHILLKTHLVNTERQYYDLQLLHSMKLQEINDFKVEFSALKSAYDSSQNSNIEWKTVNSSQLDDLMKKYEASQQFIKELKDILERNASEMENLQKNNTVLTESKTILEGHLKEMELEKNQLILELEGAHTQIKNYKEALVVTDMKTNHEDKYKEIMHLKEREDNVPREDHTILIQESKLQTQLNPSISSDDYTSLLDRNRFLELELSKYLQIHQLGEPEENEESTEMSKAQTSELIQTETSELIQTVKSPTSKLQKNFKKDAKILALSRKVTQLEEQLDICQSDIQLKEGQLSSLQEQLHQNINSTSMKTVESSKPMSDEVLNLKKMLKKKEARIAVLNKKINENVSTVTSTTSSYPVLTDDFSTQQILDEANAKLFLEQERRDVLEKQLDELSTERADIVIQLDQIPLLRSLIEEKELALNDLKKLNSQLVLQNKELMKRLNMEQKTAETDLEFSRHLQAMLQSQNIKLSEQTDSIEAVEEKYLKREHHLLDKINLKENEIELLKHDMKKMTENVIETEILMKSVQTEISHYKQQISTLKEEIVSMGDAYTEQLNQVNGDVFEFMKNNLKIPRIVIGEEPLLDNKEIVNPDPEMQDYLKLKQNLQHMESNNQSLNEKVQKLEIQLQYEKDLAHSMATRYKEEVKEISELRTQVHKLQKKGSTSQNDDKEDDADSTISSNEAVENYERTEIARLVERLRQDDYDLEILSDQKRDLERELDDVLDELHRKDDMLYQTKDELNSSLNFIDELESDLRDRNDEILSLKNMLEKSHTDVLHLRDELHYKDSLIGTISPKAPSSRTQSFESLDEVSSYQKKIQKKNAKILVLNKKIEKLTEEMQMSKSMDGFGEYVSDRITALESCVKERESQIKDLEAQIASYETSEVGDTKLRKLLKKKEAKILVLNKKLAELTTSVESSLNTSMHSDISVSQESLNNPESLSSMYTVDIQQKDQHIQELTKYISDLKSNLNYYQQVLVEKEAELVQGHAQLKETERMLSTVTNDQEKLKKVMQQNEEELERLNEKWTNAKQNLEESYGEQDMHYNQFRLVENQKADLELQILDMKKHHSEMSAYSEGLWNELGELKLNYETLLSEKEDLEVHVQKLSKEKEDVEVKILETQNEVQELRIEKDKLESDLTQTRDNLESEVKDNQTKESKIIQLTYTIQEIEKKSIAFQQSISEKDIVIEQLIEKLNVEQEQKNTTENLDKAVIKHLEEKHQNNLKEMEDLSETCQIQKANLEVTKHMLEEKDVLIEQLQQKSFDAESVGDLQASLSVKEHKISELLIEQEELNQKLTEINEAKEAAVNVNLNLKEENEEFRQQSINIQTDYVEMKQQHDDVQHRLDEANLLLLEKDWLLHDLQKQLQVSQSSQCNEESELHQEIIMKEKSLEEFKTVTSSLRSDLQALHQEKDQQVCNLSGEISDLKQELKSWQDREDQASSSMRIKDQDISELQEKLTTMQEYNSKMEEEFKNLYLKEKSYIEKCKQQSDVIHEFQTKLEATEADCNSKTLEIAELTQKIDKFIEDSKGGLEITSSDLPKLQSNLKRRDAKILILTKKLNDSQECLQQKSRELDDIKNASGERMYVKEVSTPDYFKQPQVVEEIMVRGENLCGAASIPHPEFEISESLEKQFSSLTSQLEESKQEIIQKNSELKSKESQVEVIRDDYEKQLAELKHKLDSYSEAESLTTEKLGSSNTVVIDLQSKLDGYISALAEKDIQFIQQTTALQQKDSNIQQLTETISELNIQIQNYAETASKLKDQLESQDEKLEVNLNHSNEKIQVLTSQLQEAINMKAELEVEFTQCRAELDNQKSIEESYLTQHVDAKQELERLTTIMQAFEVKEKNLQESLQTSITNEESLKSQLSGFQSQLETANQMLEQYQGNSSDKENELVLMIERNGSLEQKIKEVNQELQRNQSKIEEHQIKEQNLIESLQQATYEVVESKKNMAEVQSQYEEVKTKSTDQETNFAEMVEKFNQQIQIKADEIMHLQTEMENTQKTLQISIASVAEKDEKIKSLLGNFQEMEARLSQLTESKTDDSGEELEKAKAEIQEKQQALDDKVLTLKKALATAKKLKFQLQKSNEKVKELEDGREEEEKRKEELQKELQEKASELEEIRSSMQSLRTDVNNADVKELEDIKTQMQSYVEYSQQLQEQVQQLRETIFSSEQQLKQRQVVLDELEGESSNLKAETVELKSAYDCLRQEMVNITQMNEDYKHTVLDKEKHVLNLSKQIEDLDSGYLSLQQQLSYKDDLNSSLVIENTRLSTLESSFEDKLEELSKFHRILQDFQISSSDQLNEQLLMVEAISGQLENMKESTVSLKEFTDLEKELSTLKSQLTENESCLSNMPMDDGGNLNDAVTERNKQIEMFKLVIQQEAQEKDKLQLLLDELKTAMAEKISDKDKELAVYIESLNSMQQKLVEKEENLQKVTKEDSTDGSLMVQLMEVIKENQTLKDEMNEMKIEGISQQTKSLEDNGNQLSEVTKENENLKLQFQQIQQINQENENLKNELQKQQAQQVALQPLSTDEEVISRRLQQSLFQISAEYESLKHKHEELILTNQVLRDELQAVPTTQVLATERTGGTWNMDANLEYDILKMKLDESLKENETLKMVLKNQSESQTPVMVSFTDDDHNKIQHNLAEVTQKHDQLKLHYGQLLQEKETLKTELEKTQPDQYLEEKANLEARLEYLKIEMESCISGKDKEIEVYAESLNKSQEKLLEKEEILQKTIKESAMMGQMVEYESLKMQFEDVVTENQRLKDEMLKQQAIHTALQPLETDDTVTFSKLQQALSEITNKYEILKSDFEKVLEEKENLTKQSVPQKVHLEGNRSPIPAEKVCQTDENNEAREETMELVKENNQLQDELQRQADKIAESPLVSDVEATSRRVQYSLSELTKEYESLKLKYEDLESEKNLIQKLNKQLQEEKAVIKADFEMQIAVVENLQHLLKENQMTIDQLHAQDEDLNTKLQMLKAERDRLKEEIESLQGQCEGLEQIVASAQMSEMDSKNQVQLMQNQLEKAKNENKSLRELLDKSPEKAKQVEFTDRMEESLVREVLHQSYAAPSKTETEVPEIKEKYASLVEEHEKVKNKLHINEVKCEKMLHKLKAFKDKNEKLTAEIEHLKKSRDEVDINVPKFDTSFLESSLEEYKTALENSTTKCQTLVKENISLKDMVTSLKEQIKTIQNELTTKAQEVDMMKVNQNSANILDLEQKLKTLSSENQELREENIIKKTSIESLTDEYKIAESRMKDLFVQIEALTFREESLNHRLEEQTKLSGVLSEKLAAAEEELAMLRPVQTEISEIKAHHDQSLSDLNENFSLETSSLKSKLENLQEQYNMLEADNQEFLILSDNLRETVKKLKKDNEEKTYLLSKRDEELLTKGDNSEISSQLEIIEGVRNELLVDVESLKSDLVQWKSEAEKRSQRIQELEIEVGNGAQMKAKILELENERDELIEEMEGLRNDMIAAKREKMGTKDEFEKYVAQIDILKTDNQGLKEHIDGLTWKLEEASGYEEELQEVQQQLSHLEMEKVARQTSSDEEIKVQVSKLEVMNKEAESLRSDVENKKSEVEELKSELKISHERLSELVKVEKVSLQLQEELEQCRVTIEKQNRQVNELNIRLQTLDDLEVEFSELNEQYNKALNDKNDMAKQIQELHDQLQKLNHVEKEINLTVEQKDHFAREKDTLQQRVNDLESQGTNVTDENAKLKQELATMKSSLQQLTFESNSLKSQLQVASSSGDQMSQFQCEYDNLQKQFNQAIEQKNKLSEDLNEACHNHQHREQRCQKLAMQVSQLAEDRSYLNAQLGHLSKSLREKESEWSNMKNQYRSLYQTHMTSQMKMVDLEKKVISETFQKAHGSSTKTSVLGHVEPNKSLIEEYKQKLESSEKLKEESKLTIEDLQEKLDKEEKRSAEIEKMLKDTQDQLLLQATRPLQEVRLQIDEDDSDSKIREHNALLTRRGMGYCRRLQRWMKVKNRQLTRIMKFRPGIRKCLWAYFIFIHVLIVMCFTGFL